MGHVLGSIASTRSSARYSHNSKAIQTLNCQLKIVVDFSWSLLNCWDPIRSVFHLLDDPSSKELSQTSYSAQLPHGHSMVSILLWCFGFWTRRPGQCNLRIHSKSNQRESKPDWEGRTVLVPWGTEQLRRSHGPRDWTTGSLYALKLLVNDLSK